jgi:hypothetical protein
MAQWVGWVLIRQRSQKVTLRRASQAEKTVFVRKEIVNKVSTG